MRIVIDTNVLVSALWSRDSKPAQVLALVQNDLAIACYDHRIMAEYKNVLRRPKFGFQEWQVIDLLGLIQVRGLSVVPAPLDMPFIDKADKKFYEVAKHCQAILVTGNIKHFPDNDPLVCTVVEFLKLYKKTDRDCI